MKKKTLNRFEILAQKFIEGNFRRFLGQETLSEVVLQALSERLEAATTDLSPSVDITIFLSSSRFPDPEPLHELVLECQSFLHQFNTEYHLANGSVQIKLDSTLIDQDVRIEIKPVYDLDSSTQVQPRPSLSQLTEIEAIQNLDAYLIVAGERHVPLEKPLITLGRQLDNDIVLDSTSISRKHAQIRWKYGRFVLHNLSKRGKTIVNGSPISEYALNPGDVITLSRTMLIYGEGHTRPGSVGPINRDDENNDLATRQLPKIEP